MWERVAICLAAMLGVAVLWNLCFRRCNRRRGERAVVLIHSALAGSGEVTAVRWLEPSVLRIMLRLHTRLFHKPQLVVRLVPRQNPLRWLRHWRRAQSDTFTFEANLEVPPGFNLQVGQHRWFGRSRAHLPAHPESWEQQPVTRLILTSRQSWQREVTGMMNALLRCREREVQSVGFSPSPPHFSAIIKPESLAAGDRTSPTVFETLKELAAEVTASRR